MRYQRDAMNAQGWEVFNRGKHYVDGNSSLCHSSCQYIKTTKDLRISPFALILRITIEIKEDSVCGILRVSPHSRSDSFQEFDPKLLL